MRNLYFASFLAILTACSVPVTEFAGTDDAGTDAPTEVTLVVSTDTAMVTEGSTATFTVQLSAPPTGSIPVTIDSGDDNRLGVTPSSVSFDSSNWNQPRTVTLAGREDTDTEEESVTITLSSSVGDDTVQVTVLDNDDLGLVLSPTGTLEVGEGQTTQITVRLNAQPSGPISVAVATGSSAVATASPTVLNFGVGNWDLPATVVVTGVDDVDTVGSTTMLTFTPDGGLDPEVVTVNVADDDVLAIEPSVANLGTRDEGDTATFTVQLSQQPSGPITVNVMSSDTTLVTAMPATIGFTTADWDQPRTVNVTLPQDMDVADETASIMLSAVGIMGTRTLPVTINDDDTQVITATPSPLALDEGMTRNLDVRLAFQPSADVTLSVTSLNTNVATVGSNMLTFTAANYATPQQVMVTATQDADALAGMTAVRIESVAENLTRDVTIAVTDDDQLLIETSAPTVTLTEGATTTFMVRLTAMPAADLVVNVNSGDTTAATVSPAMLNFTSSSWNTFQMVTVTGVHDLDLATENLVLTLNTAGVPPKTVDATVNDDDTQRVVVSSATTTVLETNTATVGVSLAFQPAANVVVTVMSSDATGASVTPTMLTFMPGNYATPQNITITGVNDPDNVDDNVTLTLTAPSATSAMVAVTVADDDILGIEPSTTTTMVGEAGTAMIGVKLTAQPPGPVTVTLMSSDTSAATVSPTMLNFTTADWDTFQNVTITGVDDADAVNDMMSISLSAPTMMTRTVTVTVQENDTQDILLTTPTITLGEAGSNTFGVRLAAQPTSDVTVNVASAGGTHATASPSSLTFTSSDYTNNKTVTVTGVQDVDLAHDNVAINMSSAGLTTRTVTATVNDDDMQEVIASSAGPFTINEGTTAMVGFSLRYQPAGSVNVTVSSGSSGVSLDRTTLTFNAGNYNSAQNVVMTGVQDANAADINTTITATSPGATQATVAVVVDDDEVLDLEVSTMSLTVNEQGTNSFGVRLTAQPLADTVVMISSGDTSTATVAPAMYTFTSSDYNNFKNVVVTGVDDVDLTADGATVTVSSPGMTSRNVGVTVNDNDMLTIQPNFTNLSVNEGSSNNMLTFRLSHMPAASVTVTVASGDTSAITVPAAPGNSLTFTTLNWATPQTMIVTAPQDADYTDENVTLTASSPSTPNATVTVTAVDDEILLDSLSVQMMPATGASFNFLGQGFTAAVTATLAGTAVSPLNVMSQTTMSGTAPNWVAPSARFQDARVVKGANQYTIARAMYRGQWAQAINGMGGGTVYCFASSGVNTVYAGTDNGVYRSNDNGNTWFAINTGMNFAINSIAADPGNANRVYAATILGVYVTTNGGASWTRTGMAASASVVAMSAATPQTLYAAYGPTIYKTTDGGTNWNSNLDMSPSNVKGIVFGTTAQITWVASTTNVARTMDGGNGWASGGGGLPNNISSISAHPTDNNTAFISSNNTLFRSTNGASSWSSIGSATGATMLTQIVATTGSSVFASTTNGVWRWDGTNFMNMSSGIPSVATSMLAIGAIGSSDIYAGNNVWGVYRSINGGTSWNASSAGLDAYTVNAIAVHPTATGTLFVSPGYMGVFKSTDRGATWAQSNGGLTLGNGQLPNDFAFSPGTPNTVWLAVINGGVRRSTDGGTTWSSTGLTLNVESIAAESATIAYTAGFGGIRKTTDGGVNWTLMNSGLPANPILRDVMISDDGAIYAAETDLVYKSTNGGASWTATPSSAAINPYKLHLDAVTGTIYVQSNSGVYKTTDDGINWTQVLGANGFAFDPMRSATLYAGAQNGMAQRSLNNGVTWVNFTTGLPTSCHGMAVDLDGQGVYCSIGRNGLWRLAP